MRALLLCAALVTLAGCRGSSTPDDADHEGYDPAANATMRASPQWAEALARYETCMHEEGYPELSIRKGVVLKDGSVVGEGGSHELKGAYLEYVVSMENCENSSGIAAVSRDFGFANPTLAPETQKRLNDKAVREMACMETKGWDIPEPVTSRGLLIFDVQIDSEEERTAYNVDFYRCLAELGTLGVN